MDNPGAFSLGDYTITTADDITTPWLSGLDGMQSASLQFRFAYGNGDGQVLVFLQTSLDEADDTPSGTAIDIACHLFVGAARTEMQNFTDERQTESASDGGGIQPTDGALEPGQAINGILGDRFRLRIRSTGTFSGPTVLSVRGVAR